MLSVTYAECHLRSASLMLSVNVSVTYAQCHTKPFMLSVVMLNVVMLIVVAPACNGHQCRKTIV